MATIKAILRSKSKRPANIRLRLLDGRDVEYFGTTNITILPDLWNPKTEEIKARVVLPDDISREEFNQSIRDIKNKVLKEYNATPNKNSLPQDWITRFLNNTSTIPQQSEEDTSFFALFDKYVEEAKVSEPRRKHMRVVRGMLRRYEQIKGITLDVKRFPVAIVTEFEIFVRDEYKFVSLFSELYQGKDDNGKKIREIKPRGQNTVNGRVKILGAFMHWARKKKYTKEDPFDEYEYVGDVYGDPVPLLPEEVELLLNKNLPKDLELVRDLFCLQCFIGCRVGDYVKLTKDNIYEGVLSYIAQKTITESPTTLYVPLMSKAIMIIDKYGYPEGKLMPFINVNGKDGYNKKLKTLCEVSGLSRPVIVINTLTRTPETKKLYEVVTTHTARKTFINSNYKETKDPKTIGKMSGHSENSRAFARYRNIDIDMLREQMEKAFNK